MQTTQQEKTAYKKRVEANMSKTIRTGIDLTGSGISEMGSTATNLGRNIHKRSGTQETVTGSDRNQYLKENPNYGFQSTSQRFSYLREMQKMGENPGPGAYKVSHQDIKEKSSPAAFNMTQGVSFKTALHTASSAGGQPGSTSFFRNQSSTSRMINQQSGSTMQPAANMPNIMLQNTA